MRFLDKVIEGKGNKDYLGTIFYSEKYNHYGLGISVNQLGVISNIWFYNSLDLYMQIDDITRRPEIIKKGHYGFALEKTLALKEAYILGAL